MIRYRGPTFFELPVVCLMLASAFKNDAMFGDFMHPYRDQYPDDPTRWWLERFRKSYYCPNEVFLVAFHPNLDDGKLYIAGVARWTRFGSPEELRKLGWATKGWWDIRNFQRKLASLYASICARMFPNRAVNPLNENCLEETAHFSKHHWDGNRSSHWSLDTLGVHPLYQGKGVGRELVAWGMDQARREKVACSVVIASGKDEFYKRCGFDTCVGRAGDGEGNAIRDVPGGNIWFRDFQNDVK